MANAQQSPGAPAHQPGLFEGIGQFLRETWAELHRVEWPKKPTVIKHTIVVVSVIVFMALYIGGWDWIFTMLFQRVLHVGAG